MNGVSPRAAENGVSPDAPVNNIIAKLTQNTVVAVPAEQGVIQAIGAIVERRVALDRDQFKVVAAVIAQEPVMPVERIIVASLTGLQSLVKLQNAAWIDPPHMDRAIGTVGHREIGCHSVN